MSNGPTQEQAAQMAICNAKPRGDFGKVLSIDYQDTPRGFTTPTKLTAQIIRGSDDLRHDVVSLWFIYLRRECAANIQCGYVDPETRSLMFLTLVVNADANGNPVGNLGFATYNDDGIQINKLLLSEPLSLLDIQDHRRFIVDRASDGSQILDGITFGNGNCGKAFELYDLPKEGGKRKTKRSKKSKRHTRR